MKCRSKPVNTHTPQRKLSAPKRGGVVYWINIIMGCFLPPLALIAIGGGILLHLLLGKTLPAIILLPAFMSPIIAFFIAKKCHRHFITLPKREYEWHYQSGKNNSHYKFHQDSNNPFDPNSFTYWTLGPGKGSD